MKVTLMMSLILLSFTSATLASKPISISTKASQLVETQLHKIKPDNDGMVLTRVIDLPKFKQGVYYRPFTAFGRGVVARGNRVEAIAFTSLSELQDYQPSKTRKDHINIQQGQYILLELYDGRYLALLPMASEKVYGQFFVAQEQLLLKTGNFGTATVSGKIPLLIWAYGDSPYSATQNALATGISVWLRCCPAPRI
ncbi:hypothetical protein [Psychrosphaera algicola]|uniref:Uncharacterized protein n=1 Tax=Psychrosphaera algicola TaxID=3023714 RepID=A0ABT5FB29_9GAMM|nr:hypothetical protein [Psychrosphaera sp. G1-22]MDC2888758.1 hypothetical protein [Psychrosphaera sp. G1-22]